MTSIAYLHHVCGQITLGHKLFSTFATNVFWIFFSWFVIMYVFLQFMHVCPQVSGQVEFITKSRPTFTVLDHVTSCVWRVYSLHWIPFHRCRTWNVSLCVSSCVRSRYYATYIFPTFSASVLSSFFIHMHLQVSGKRRFIFKSSRAFFAGVKFFYCVSSCVKLGYSGYWILFHIFCKCKV